MTTLTTPARVEGTLDPLLGSDGLPWPQTFDGQTWAKEFIRHVHERPEIATDEGTMIAWFANAIMVGYDRARQEPNNAHADGSAASADTVRRDVGTGVNPCA